VQGVTVSPARYNNTQLFLGLLWKSDRPVADATQNTHNRKTFMLSAGFFFCFFLLVLCTSYVIVSSFVLIVLHFAFLSVLASHNTNIDAPGGIQARNPSKRANANRRLRPLDLTIGGIYLDIK
jgi:hypothetical protein